MQSAYTPAAGQFADLADHPAFLSNLAPVHEEHEGLPAALVAGELPAEVCGTLMRIGPNPRFAPPVPSEHHWFLGDGMIHALRLQEGRCTYSNRWIRTRKWIAEDEAGRALVSGWGYRPIEGGPAIAHDGTANTNLVRTGRGLWALQESSPPILIGEADLSTGGQETFDGRLAMPFTAHPKQDAQSGGWVGHGVQIGGFASQLAHHCEIDAAGCLIRLDRYELPCAAYVHDFLVTQRHVILPLSPLVADRASARRGQPYVWHGDRPSMVGVFTREDGPSGIRWIEAPAFYVFHVFNAYDDGGGSIVADVLEYSRPPLFPDPTGRVPTTDEINSAVTRWRIDLTGHGSLSRERVCDSPAFSLEFPVIDGRRGTVEHRVGYFVGREDGDRPGFNTLCRVDFRSGSATARRYGPHDMLSEPIFVPRSAEAPADDGWLAFLVFRAATGASELHLQDANDLDGEPRAVFALPRRVPQGFHGCWLPDDVR
jgi:carotenoid cleavage dioxygenase